MKAMLSLALVLSLAFVSFTSPPASPPPPSWKIIGWNNLGMHCMDSDYGVFSILPPYNVVSAQVIQSDGHLLTSPGGRTVSYEAVADPSGSINRTSAGKTNFWQFSTQLYGSSNVPDTGLAGFNMPGPTNVPQAMSFDAGPHLFTGNGVPIVPYDDAGHKRPYPMMKLSLKSSTGTTLASTKTVLPVSDEMDCRVCHASGSPSAAMPAQGWLYDPNAERDYRLNILRRHDQHLGEPVFAAALVAAGYSPAGLHATVAIGGTPILCARCHASNALPGTGMSGISALTSAVHAGHSNVVDPTNGLTLGQSSNRSACYRCHPGSDTRCLRGAMGTAVASDGTLAIQCQSCHGGMAAVGNPARVGWLQEPSCQNCHTGTATANSGQIRYTSAFLPNGDLRQPADTTFATNPDVPAPGFSLYRFSSGHGGLQCEACHGATHAEYPSSHGNDNVQSITMQGHAGVLAECVACHDAPPTTANGGPHGMHPLGQSWVVDHHDVVEGTGVQQCRVCHGVSLAGTVLSTAHADRTFTTNWGTKTYFRGSRISCFGCHDGPNSSDPPSNQRGTAQNATVFSNGVPVTTTLVVTDPNQSQTLTYRIVQQPAWGTVALAANVATYHPVPGFAGIDTFTFAAFDGMLDSTLGTITVVRGAEWANYGTGYPGSGGVVPGFILSARPQLGTTVVVSMANTAGTPTQAYLGLSSDPASIPSGLGGVVLIEPTNVTGFLLPASGLSLAWSIPNDPLLTGAVIHAQVAMADSGALFGWAFTRGVRVILGP